MCAFRSRQAYFTKVLLLFLACFLLFNENTAHIALILSGIIYGRASMYREY
jgi:hypothetical protein